MEAFEEVLFQILGVLVLIGGVYTLVKGRFKIGIEGIDAYDRVITGRRARWLGVGFIAAGFWFFVDVRLAVMATVTRVRRVLTRHKRSGMTATAAALGQVAMRGSFAVVCVASSCGGWRVKTRPTGPRMHQAA